MRIAAPAQAADDFTKQAGRLLNSQRRALQTASSYSSDTSPDTSGIQAFPDQGQAYPQQDMSDASSE